MVVACPRSVIGVAVKPEVGISGDTQRFKSIRNDQVTDHELLLSGDELVQQLGELIAELT